jgi:type IV pilus assembly protein PilN
MVRINLIPSDQQVRRKRKPLEIENQLILASILMSVVVLMLGSFWILLDRKIASLDMEKSQKLSELEVLKAQVKEVENYEQDKKMVTDRITVIEKLRATQAIPVQLLDGISEGIPARVWLTGLSENSGRIDLSGRSMTNSEIVDFVNNLKKNPVFKEVHLIESRQEVEGGVPVYSFKLAFSVLT